MYQGIFVDAAEADKHFAELMSSKGRYGLRVEFQKPDEMMTLAKEILSSQPDLVLCHGIRQQRFSNYFGLISR